MIRMISRCVKWWWWRWLFPYFGSGDIAQSLSARPVIGNVCILSNVQIPAGTQSHDRHRLAGKGISRVNSHGYGDHYVHFKIKVPV